jgi:putative spermidine/putrescine transport system permease protein
MTAAGRGEARQLNSAMSAIYRATIYTATMLVMLVVALRFVNPTQLVAQVKETRDD